MNKFCTRSISKLVRDDMFVPGDRIKRRDGRRFGGHGSTVVKVLVGNAWNRDVYVLSDGAWEMDKDWVHKHCVLASENVETTQSTPVPTVEEAPVELTSFYMVASASHLKGDGPVTVIRRKFSSESDATKAATKLARECNAPYIVMKSYAVVRPIEAPVKVEIL